MKADCFWHEGRSGSFMRWHPAYAVSVFVVFHFEGNPSAGWNSSRYRLGACYDIFGVLCTVYSLLPHCFIWTFLTRIALNYARRGAVWLPLKMKYLLVFSQAEDQRGRQFTWSRVTAPSSTWCSANPCFSFRDLRHERRILIGYDWGWFMPQTFCLPACQKPSEGPLCILVWGFLGENKQSRPS